MTGAVRTRHGLRPAPTDLRLEVTTDQGRWDQACAAAAASGQRVTAFHTWTWLHAGAAMTDSRLVPMIVSRGNEDLGVVPALIRRQGPFLTMGCVPFPYCGPLVPLAEQAACFDLLRQYARRRHLLRTVIQFGPSADVDEQSLEHLGFSVSHDATYVVDTTVGVDALWSGLHRNARSKVNQTRRNGIELVYEATTEPLDAFEVATFTDRGIDSGYTTKLSAHLDLLVGADLRVRHATAMHDGEALGVLLTFASEHEALGWVGGVLPQHRSSSANYALYWDAIQWACGLGVERLDLVGVVNEGVARFKKQFGGALVPYTSAQLDSKAASLVYSVHDRLTGRSQSD